MFGRFSNERLKFRAPTNHQHRLMRDNGTWLLFSLSSLVGLSHGVCVCCCCCTGAGVAWSRCRLLTVQANPADAVGQRKESDNRNRQQQRNNTNKNRQQHNNTHTNQAHSNTHAHPTRGYEPNDRGTRHAVVCWSQRMLCAWGPQSHVAQDDSPR